MKKAYKSPKIEILNIQTSILATTPSTPTDLKYGGVNSAEDAPTVAESQSFWGSLEMSPNGEE